VADLAKCDSCKSFFPGCEPSDCNNLDLDLKEIELYPVSFERVQEDAILPQRMTRQSAGYDLYANETTVIQPFSVKIVPTGVKVRMPYWMYLQLSVRSSIGIKQQLIMPNGIGIIDADYYNNPDNGGHIFVPLLNMSSRTITIDKHTRIAQGVFLNYNMVDRDHPMCEDRYGGCGSTGV
jgi:dUTP pyrophosphatase